MLYLLEMLLLYLLAAVCEDDLSQELTFITDVGGFAETHRGRRPRRSERL